MELDLPALAGKQITLSVDFNTEKGEGMNTAGTTLLSSTMTVPALNTPLARESCDAHGRCRPVLPLRTPFVLDKVPTSFDDDTTEATDTTAAAIG